ncbi:MAG TPA: efflux RND transporter permease subunit [Pirellulales bacterium]
MNSDATHPSLDLLISFDRGLLTAEQWPEIDEHMAGCPQCCQQLEQLPDDYVLAMLRQSPTGADPHERNGHGERSPQEPPPAEVPAELAVHSRYRVVEILGQGGMGTVYKAEHKLMGRLVALKVISNRYLDRPEWLERFRREIKAAAQLDHPNIIQAYDAEEVGSSQVLVMEYAPGENLERYLKRRGPLPVHEACEYVRQAALGLEHAYERGMVHRDIKPQNLLRTPSGKIRILDFGLARFASESAMPGSLTQSGLTVGTPDYIAPEQALDARRADIRADIYSLGCTLYQLLCGAPPFPNGTPIQKVMRHQGEAPAPLRSRRADVPRGLAKVVDKMLAKDPNHRYQTPAAVADGLAPWATAPQPSNCSPITHDPAARRPRRFARVFAATLVLLSIGAASWAWTMAASQNSGADDQAPAVLVWTRSAAMSAPAVEKAITNQIERRIIEAPGVARIESRSIAGQSMIKAYFRPDASPAAVSALASLAASALEELPERTPRPIVVPFDARRPEPIGAIAVQHPQLDKVQLTDLVRKHVLGCFGAVPGLGPLALLGARERAVVVHFDRIKLQARGMTPAGILRVLRGHPAFAEPSKISVGDTQYSVVLSSGTLDQLKRVPVGVASHSVEYLSDVGRLEEAILDAEDRIRLDGANGICIPLFLQVGASQADVETATKELLAKLQPQMPGGTQLRYLRFEDGEADGETSSVVVRLRLPTGTTLDATERAVADIERGITDTVARDQREYLFTEIGATDNWISAFSEHSASCDASIRLRLTDAAAEDVAARLWGLFKHDQRFVTLTVTTAASMSLTVSVFCETAAERWTTAEKVRDQLAKITDVEIVERNDAPTFQFDLNLAKAADLGMDASAARAQIAELLAGLRTRWVDLQSGVTYRPASLLAGGDAKGTADLLNLPLGDNGTRSFRLGDIASIQRGVEPAEIAHQHLQPVLHVRAIVLRKDRASAVAEIKATLATMSLPAGARVELDE